MRYLLSVLSEGGDALRVCALSGTNFRSPVLADLRVGRGATPWQVSAHGLSVRPQSQRRRAEVSKSGLSIPRSDCAARRLHP
ncbi:hypothetical protein [Caudoviricetes sp.]|nr:hypothetical protein [Caudoviricetes sp.]